MVLTSDGNSEIGAHVRINLCYLICLRHLIRSRVVTIRSISPKKTFFPSCQLPAIKHISTMIPSGSAFTVVVGRSLLVLFADWQFRMFSLYTYNSMFWLFYYFHSDNFMVTYPISLHVLSIVCIFSYRVIFNGEFDKIFCLVSGSGK